MDKRSFYLCLGGISFLGLYALFWNIWRSGSELVSGTWVNHSHSYRIEVREIPSSAPLWALPLSLIPDENPFYRCEYYRFDERVLYSAHTFQGDSFNANSGRIEWDEQGAAIIYLDLDPVLGCDDAGFWSAIK